MVTFFRAAFKVNVGIIAVPREGRMAADRAFRVRRFRSGFVARLESKLMVAVTAKVFLRA